MTFSAYICVVYLKHSLLTRVLLNSQRYTEKTKLLLIYSGKAVKKIGNGLPEPNKEKV